MHPGKALREVWSGIPKGVGKSLGTARVWYHCVEETRWNRQMSSWQIKSLS